MSLFREHVLKIIEVTFENIKICNSMDQNSHIYLGL
jgi:hypothetical protein